jgi:hypothetical protein
MNALSKSKNWEHFPNTPILSGLTISDIFIKRAIHNFHDACQYVHNLPYGYNSDRDDLLILFKENFGSCTTKHAVIATLAQELALPIQKAMVVYAMTEQLVTGTQAILDQYNLPYIPMIHCLLIYDDHRIDLTEGNQNGKNQPIVDLLYSHPVAANISAKDEYLLYREALEKLVQAKQELQDISIKQILKARQEGLSLLRSKVH